MCVCVREKAALLEVRLLLPPTLASRSGAVCRAYLSAVESSPPPALFPLSVCVCACVCVLGLLSPRCLSVDHPRWSPCLLLFAEPTFLQWACRPPLHCSLCLPVRVSGYDAPCPPAGFRRPRGAHAATAPCCTCCGGCGPAAWGTHFGASPPVPDPGELLSRFALRCSSLSMS